MKSLTIRIPRLLALVLAGFIFFQGCGDNPQKEGPEATANAFLKAMQFGDYDKASSYCSESTAKNLGLMSTMSGFGANPMKEDFEITGSEVDGDYATVFYDQGGKQGKRVNLRNDNGKWVVLANKADFGTDSDNKQGNSLFDSEEEEEEEDESEDEPADLFSKKTEESPADKYLEYRKGKSAEQVAKSFLKALQYGDYEQAKRYGSKSTNEMLEMQSSLSGLGDKDKKGEMTVLRVKEDGDFAQAFYKEAGKKGEKILKLGKDDQGNWEVIMSKNEINED